MKLIFALKLFWSKHSRKLFFFVTISLLAIGFSASYFNLKHQIGNNRHQFIHAKDIEEIIEHKYLFKITFDQPNEKTPNIYKITFAHPFLNQVDFIGTLEVLEKNLPQTKLSKIIIKRLKNWIVWIKQKLKNLNKLVKYALSSRSLITKNVLPKTSKNLIINKLKQRKKLFFQTQINFLKWFIIQFLVDVNSLPTVKTSAIIREFNQNLSKLTQKKSSINSKIKNVFYI